MSLEPSSPLAGLLDALPEAAVAIDGGGKLYAANGLARLLLGAGGAGPDGTLEGRPFLDVIRVGPEGTQALNELARNPAAVELEAEVDVEGAEPRRLVVKIGSLGGSSGYVATLRDVADERRREQIRLTHEKLAAISQLAAGVAHEFNNIMASLYGFAQLAREDAAFNDELVAAVEEYAERSREITRRLRSFSPEKSGPLEAVSFPELLDVVLARFSSDLEPASIRVERRFRAVPETLVNRREIEEVLESIIDNARNAIVKSGTITIDVWPEDRTICIRVADTGYGIPRDNLTRVFEPFFTLKQTTGRVRPGSGLGLAVAYNYVRRHQGEIWAESEPGRGTRFTIKLPVRAERRARSPSGPATPPPAALPAATPSGAGAPDGVERRTGGARVSRTILAVDDEESMTKLLESILVEHRLVSARNGREAMAAFNRKGPFDYIILDIVMPGELDGFEIFNEIIKRDKAAKVILLTGMVEDERVKEYAARAYGYLRKPFGIKDLSSLIV